MLVSACPKTSCSVVFSVSLRVGLVSPLGASASCCSALRDVVVCFLPLPAPLLCSGCDACSCLAFRTRSLYLSLAPGVVLNHVSPLQMFPGSMRFCCLWFRLCHASSMCCSSGLSAYFTIVLEVADVCLWDWTVVSGYEQGSSVLCVMSHEVALFIPIPVVCVASYCLCCWSCWCECHCWRDHANLSLLSVLHCKCCPLW